MSFIRDVLEFGVNVFTVACILAAMVLVFMVCFLIAQMVVQSFIR